MTPDKLRETLDWVAKYSGSNILVHKQQQLIDQAARLYLAILDGDMVVVPRVPSEEMIAAGFGSYVQEWDDALQSADIAPIYKAMLNAALDQTQRE